MVSFKVLN